MKLITLNHKKPFLEVDIRLPESWEEISQYKFIKLANILIDDELTDIERNIRVCLLLSGEKEETFCDIDYTDLKDKAFPVIQFVQELIFSKSMVQELHLKDSIIYGPGELMENMSFDQYRWAQIRTTQLFDIEKGKFDFDNNDLLTELAATLYRIEKDEWNDEMFKRLSRNFLRVDKKLKVAIVLNFIGLIHAFKGRYPAAFSEEESDSGLPSMLHPYDVLIDELAGPNFGKKSEVYSTNVHDIFSHIQNLKEKEFKQKIKKMAQTN